MPVGGKHGKPLADRLMSGGGVGAASAFLISSLIAALSVIPFALA